MTIVLALVGALIAGATWWTGWQNMQIARVKLQHDLYERRFRVFDATRTLLNRVLQDTEGWEKAVGAHYAATVDAVFLFDEDMDRYLSDMRNRVFEYGRADKRSARHPDDDDMQRASDEGYDSLDQRLKELVIRFRPYLTYPEIRTVPLRLEQLWRRLRP